MKEARFMVDAEFLVSALNLPGGTKLLDVGWSEGQQRVSILVEHESIPESRAPHRARPAFQKGDDGTVTMIDWGLQR